MEVLIISENAMTVIVLCYSFGYENVFMSITLLHKNVCFFNLNPVMKYWWFTIWHWRWSNRYKVNKFIEHCFISIKTQLSS